ncbi:hypothetical protein IP86_03655 [Rhodopseudomonas sp. AAP120]|uniref:hypothetical protein n=1 Tax=Rhodopseudomonas sp. AAP120 TaxID=1523430 RepID=UPI0006B8EF47|nr:hypothetical protein [Rhodopseudomonas sp. AAP120]KPG01522.1 hypothetical protein IP86_03655 [Rhodopseudomonas sp. AAP120]
MARSASAMTLAVLLMSCSSILEALPETAGQAPSLTAAAEGIRKVAAEAKLAEPLELGGPIEANPVTVAPWIICLRSATPGPTRSTYALFYRDAKLVSWRFSAIVDRCEEQTFSPLK